MNEFSRPASDPSFALRLSAFYIATFFIVGCYMAFLPVWLRWRGLDDGQIALIYALPVFVRAVFTPVMTFLADRSGQPLGLLKWLAWGSFLSVLMLPFANGFLAILAVMLLFTLFWLSVIPLTDAVALTGARAGKADYGRMRLWGSFGYIAMTVSAGMAVGVWGPAAALWMFVGAAAVVLATAYVLPRSVPGDGEPPLTKLRLADLGPLIGSPMLWLFLAATSATQAAHSVYYIFGTLHWTAAGISPTIIGALWGIGVIAEIVLFAYGAWVSRWFSPPQLLALAGAAAVLRWTITAYDPPLPLLFLTQCLHGLTFGAAHLGAMHFMNRALPERLSASGQGFYASITAGVAMGLASLAAGPLYRHLDGGAYLAMAGLAFVGMVLSLTLMRRWDGGLILTPKGQTAPAE